MIAVSRAYRIGFAGLAQLLHRIVAHRLQHSEARPVADVFGHHKGLVHERGEVIEDRILLHATIGADSPRGLVVKAAAENGQPAKQHAFGFAQQSVGPVDRRPQRLFATQRGRRTVGLQPEAVPQAVEYLGQRHHPHSRRRELDPQGQTVQTSADFAHGSGVGGGDTGVGPSQPRAVDEELDRFVGERQRRHPPGQLAGHPDRRTAGSQNRQPGARAQERVGQYTTRVDQVLTIVQHHQRVPVADESHERVHRGAARLVREAERAQHRYRDHLGIGSPARDPQTTPPPNSAAVCT